MALAKKSFGVLVTALGLFVAVEGWLTFAHPLSHLPVATLEQGELYNSIKCIEKETSGKECAPYVVLLGSSLMVAPVVQSETQYRKKPVKRFFERRATACENSLNNLVLSSPRNKTVRIYNAAVGGGMVSDDYFVARQLLQSKNPPVAIICGVAPRDFQDNLVPGTYSTSAFQILSNVNDLSPVFADKNLSLDRKFDVCMGRVSSLWRNRAELKSYFGLISKKVIERACPSVLFDKYGPTLTLSPQRKGTFPEEVKGTPMAYPGYAIDHYDALKTAQQYMRSYNPIDKKMVDEQFAYFQRLLTLAEKSGVDLFIVNMPLSRSNKQLMPAGFYQSYLSRLNSVCTGSTVTLRDFNKSQWDDDGNFIDTVHIKPEKSIQFIGELMKSVADSPVALSFSRRKNMSVGARSGSQPQ